MSKEEYIKELLNWISKESILVIDGEGRLRRIYCPFKVISLVAFPTITKGEKVSVEAIKLTMEVKEVYIIKGVPYFIIYFQIVLDS